MSQSKWWLDAACKGQDELFFCYQHDRRLVGKAKAICSSCPVQTPCAKEGMSAEFGIWAGKTARERGFTQVVLSDRKRRELRAAV